MYKRQVDYPSKNNNKRVPILDLEVWMDRDEEGDWQVRWAFYEKPMKNKFVIMEKSAVSSNSQRTTLVNEVVRRLRNCHKGIPEKETRGILEKFSRKMRRSGHKEKMRREVIDAGVKIHAEQVEKDEAGEKTMAKEEKKKRGGNKQRDWYKKKKGGNKKEKVEAVMMVPYTPGSQLLRKFKEITQRNKMNIKFVEKGGYSVQNLLEESDPFRPPTCGRERCQPCAAAGGRNSKCDSRGGAYEIVCKECEEIKAAYYGCLLYTSPSPRD